LDAAMTGKKIVRNIFYGLGAVTVLLLASGGYVAYKMSQADLSKLPNKPLVVLEWHTEAYGLQARQMRDVLYNFDSLSPSQKDDLRNSLIQLFSSKSFRDVIHGYQNDEYLERKFLNSTSSIPKVVATEDSPKLYAKWELKYDQVSTNLGKALGQDNYIGNVHNIMMYIFGPELYLKHSGQTPQERSMNIVPIEGEPTDHELNLQNRLEQSEQVNFDPESTNSRAKLFSIEDSMAKRVDRTGNALTDVELDQVNTFKKPNVRAWVKADLELWNEFLTIVHQRNVTDSKNLQTLTAEGKQALLFIGSSHVPKIYSLLPHTNRRLVDTTPDSKYVEIDRIWDHADRDEPWSVVLPESDSWGTDYIDFSRFTNSVPLTPTNQAPAIYNGGTNTVPTINTNTVLNVTVNHLGQELNKDGNPVNGGIDLNQINFSRTGQRVNLQFDAAQMSEITRPDFNGFRIIIKSVTQIQNPLSLMGVHVLK